MARIKPQTLLQQSKNKKVPSRISLPTILLFTFLVFMLIFFIFSTYRSVNSSEDVGLGHKRTRDSTNSAVPNYAIMKGEGGRTLHTSKGLIVVELFKDASPDVVDKFIKFCEKGKLKGMQIHRVIKHYMIQAGEVNSIGVDEEWALRGKNYNQLDTSMKHEAFMVGTSKANKGGRVFQLYITTAPIPDLNDKISVFGRVVEGEDVVQEIEEVDTDDHYVPKSSIAIIDVTLDHEKKKV